MLTTTKTNFQEFQVKCGNKKLNAFIVKRETSNDWDLLVGDDAFSGDWVETFDTKKEALIWLEKNPKLAGENGVKII